MPIKVLRHNRLFKILNALIGLDTKVVEDEYAIKYWDGVKREIDAWNQDHTLGSGMRHSVVWYYQELAREIGESEMKEGLVKANYGNKDISGGIDEFWLSSSLQISPVEQAHFLAAYIGKNYRLMSMRKKRLSG